MRESRTKGGLPALQRLHESYKRDLIEVGNRCMIGKNNFNAALYAQEANALMDRYVDLAQRTTDVDFETIVRTFTE